MKKKALLFNIPTEERKKIKKALLPLKIAVETVDKADYKQSLGILAGSKQTQRTDEIYDGNELEGQMMLLCDIFGATMDRALKALKKEGVSRDCLKAVVTVTNSSWNALQLYEELKKEHEFMNSQS